MRSAAGVAMALAITALTLGGISACTAGTSAGPHADPAPSATSAMPEPSTPAPLGGAGAAAVPVSPAVAATPQQTVSVAPTVRPTPDHSIASVAVSVTTSGWDSKAQQLWVAGFVPTPEDGGTCTLAAKKGTQSVVVQRSATPDATTTTCGSVTIDAARLSPGTWTAVLAYQSPTRAGAAGPVTIEVP